MTRLTPLGAIATLVGVLGFWTAFYWGTLTPAFGGAALLGVVTIARRQVAGTGMRTARSLPPRIRAGQPFTVHLRVDGDDLRPLRLDDGLPAGIQVQSEERVLGRGSAEVRYTAVAEAPGRLRWTHAVIHARDLWGFWDLALHHPAPDTAHVIPEPTWSSRGHGAGRRHRVLKSVRAARGMEPQPEVAQLREYVPGDRVRDIDWRRASLQQGMWTRERQRTAPRPIIVLLDATPAMRVPGLHSRLASAAKLASGVAGAAEKAGAAAACIAFHEEGVYHDPDLGAPQGRRGVLERLTALPPATMEEAVEDSAQVLLGGEERRFLQQSSVATLGAPLPPWQAALALLQRRITVSALVVAILDAENSPERTVAAVGRMHRQGLQVVVAVPAIGAHHHRRGDLTADGEKAVRRAYAARQHVAHELTRMRVPLFALRPDNIDDVIEEVARYAQ